MTKPTAHKLAYIIMRAIDGHADLEHMGMFVRGRDDIEQPIYRSSTSQPVAGAINLRLQECNDDGTYSLCGWYRIIVVDYNPEG